MSTVMSTYVPLSHATNKNDERFVSVFSSTHKAYIVFHIARHDPNGQRGAILQHALSLVITQRALIGLSY